MMRRSVLWLCPNFMPILMPALSPTMESATLIEWKAVPGTRVEPGSTFCMIQTDKAVVGFENQLEDGYFAKALAKVGDVVPVNGIIGIMVEDEADVAKADQYVPPTPKAAEAAPAPVKEAEVVSAAPTPSPPSKPTGGLYGGSVEEAIRASGPVVVRIAGSVGAEKLSTIVPTGKNGRFTKADVLHLETAPTSPVTETAAPTPVAAPSATSKFGVVLKVQPVINFGASDRTVLKSIMGPKVAPKKAAL